MGLRRFHRSAPWYIAAICLFATVLLGIVLSFEPVWEMGLRFYSFLSNRENIQQFVVSTGEKGPVVFIGFQVLQVLFAPVPGEATGFIGGYLFGVTKGFLYSTVGLTIGSIINFSVGRILGLKYIRGWISLERFEKYDLILKKKGVWIIFLLFLFPGFPKDWLCLFLGISSLSFRSLLLISTVGRMPGTLMLSIQGRMLFEKNYGALVFLVIVCLLISSFVYRYKKGINAWIGKLNE